MQRYPDCIPALLIAVSKWLSAGDEKYVNSFDPYLRLLQQCTLLPEYYQIRTVSRATH
jgi:hypothetical protein